jgi:hypothetical protein
MARTKQTARRSTVQPDSNANGTNVVTDTTNNNNNNTTNHQQSPKDNANEKPKETTASAMPKSPDYSPSSPQFSPPSPNYRPASPQYSPSSPKYSPGSPQYTVRSPQYSPAHSPRGDYDPRSPLPKDVADKYNQPARNPKRKRNEDDDDNNSNSDDEHSHCEPDMGVRSPSQSPIPKRPRYHTVPGWAIQPNPKMRNEIHHHIHKIADIVFAQNPQLTSSHNESIDRIIERAKNDMITELEDLIANDRRDNYHRQ